MGVLLAAAASIIVGTSFAASAAIDDFPLLTGQAARYLVAALVLTALLRGRLGRLSRREMLSLAGVAGFGMVLFNVCVVRAVDHAAPSTVGALVGCAPILMSLSAPNRRLVTAAVVVAAGAALTQGVGGATSAGIALGLAALTCEALFSLLATGVLVRIGALRLSAWACWIGAAQCVVIALATEHARMPTGPELAALTYLALPVTVGAFVAWYSGMARLGVERAGLLLGLMPVAAYLAGVTLGVERLAVGAVAGVLLVGAGVALGLRSPGSRAARRRSRGVPRGRKAAALCPETAARAR